MKEDTSNKDTITINNKCIEIESCEYQNYIPLWKEPNPRQEWVHQEDGTYVSSLFLTPEERSATHSDLVLDLVYVVLLSSLSRAFQSSIDDHPLIALRDLFALFSPIWHSWLGIARFLNQFQENDLVFTSFFFLNLILSALVGINAESCGTSKNRSGCADFVWSIAGLRLLTILGYFYVWCFNPHYHKLFKARILNDGCRMCLWFTSGFFFPNPDSDCHDKSILDPCWQFFIAFWWIAWFSDNFQWIYFHYLLYSGYYKGKSEILPMNTKIAVERNSLFLVISLGEIITASLVPSYKVDEIESEEHTRRLQVSAHDDYALYTVSSLAPVSLIILMAGLIKLLLFDLNPAPSPTGNTAGRHALNRTHRTGTIWLFTHMPLNACIVIIGALLEPLKAESQISYYASMVLSSAVASLILMIMILDLQHDEGIKRRRVPRTFRVIISFCFALLIVALWFLGDWHTTSTLSNNFVLFIDIMLMLYVGFTFYSHFPPGSKRSNEELCMIAECNGQLSRPLLKSRSTQNTVNGGFEVNYNDDGDDGGVNNLREDGNVPCECY